MREKDDEPLWETNTFEKNEIPDLKEKTITIPEFQRGPVWNNEKRIDLIYTIKNDLPFGCILLSHNEERKRKLLMSKKKMRNKNDFYKIIDGQQRCNTIFSFMDRPNEFFSKRNIDDKLVKEILKNFDKDKIQDEYEFIEKIKNDLIKYVVAEENWREIQYNVFAKKFYEDHKNYYISQIDAEQEERRLSQIIKPMIKEFILFVDEVMRKIRIPAIIYRGNENKLPEIFININSMGTPLTKFDLYNTSWSKEVIKLDENSSKMEIQEKRQDISGIVDIIMEKYNSRQRDENNFSLDDFTTVLDEIEENGKVKIFDAIYGFGKYIYENHKNLFNGSPKPEVIDSIGFNLVNSCLGYKINQIKDLPKNMQNDGIFDDVDVLFCKILECIDDVKIAINCIVNGKNNSKGSTEWDRVYQTPAEYQICSLIASYFINKYVTYEFDDEGKIKNKKIHLKEENDSWPKYKEEFFKYAKIKYVCDILKGQWKGSGDSKLYNVIYNARYYTNEISEDDFKTELDSWYKDMNQGRQEISKVSPPKEAEKVLLMIIYSQLPTSQYTDKSLKFEIEHIAPKKQMFEKLAVFDGDLALPIGSFGNLCYLTHRDNQFKKKKNIYQADFKEDDIRRIENYYTFTQKEDLEWMDDNYTKERINELEEKYNTYINKRYNILRQKIANVLYDKIENGEKDNVENNDNI